MAIIKKEREREAWLLASVILNVIFSIAKLTWGITVGVTVVLADGIHSISDIIGALLVFLALHFAGHKSKRFPFGMHKLEDLAATVGGIAIILAGIGIIQTVFFHKGIKTPENITGTLIFMAVIILIETIFFVFERKAAVRLHSPGVKTDALNWLGDIGASIVVIAGISGWYFHIPYAQEIAVIIIIIMIFYGAWEILRDAFLSLLDASVDPEIIDKAQNIILEFEEVSRIERLFIRRSGSVLFADIVLQVKEKNMESAHLLIDKVEKALHDKLDNLAIATIHYEPEQKPLKKVALLWDASKQNIAETFGRAAWIEIREISHDGKTVKRTLNKNPMAGSRRGKAIKLAAWLIKNQIDQIIFHPHNLEEDLQTLFSALGMEITEKFSEKNKNSND